MKKLWRDYNLSIILLLLFIGSLIGHFVFQWNVFLNDAQMHGEVVRVEEYYSDFLASLFENWQSEFLQLFTFVFLATYFIHRGSPQSKDGDEKMREMLRSINKKLDKL